MHKLTIAWSITLLLIAQISLAEKKIDLSFMTEVSGFRLLEIAEDSSTIEKLKEVEAELYIGLIDFSKERTKALQIFKEKGIECHAWLLLNKGEGYFPNAHNAEAYIKRFNEFISWSQKNGFQWNSLCISLAPYTTDQRIVDHGYISISKVFLKRMISGSIQSQGDIEYGKLRSLAKKNNLKTVNIVSPYMVDGREVNVDTWKQITGTFDILHDEEYIEIFNHYTPSTILTLAQLKSYQSGFKNIVVGSANEKKPLSKEENPRPLQWKELTQYITLLRQYDKSIIIYGLDGAVKGDILNNLSQHLTDDKLPNLKAAEEEIIKERENTQVVLSILSHTGYLLFFGLFCFLTFFIATIRTLKLIF
ncbi:hypothetical protein MY04_0855 [Flammeovirga sp. MY04]|uniref:hypothetical protein n=1 Tax=Flammeovirga sp. MY04 TaxID=1191459 RepID=UPI000824C5B4|nr:hypothetical protein [Flammeovirga sp. MY04]ANQ48237.2 hypothetical protein MY04_0855 [Flammeovirga sp. MY04]